jgi:hypothetical protein
MLTCFGMIWNCDNFSRWNAKFGKFVQFQKLISTQKFFVKKKRHIEATINTIKSFKIFHLKIPLYENMFFLQKEL